MIVAVDFRTACAIASVPGRSEYGKHVEVGQRQLLEQVARSSREVRVRLAGKADDDVGADRRVGHGASDALDETAVVRGRYKAAASRAASSSEPCCSGRWKCGASRCEPLTSSTISGVQSIGSSELMRNSTSSVHVGERANERRQRRAVAEVAAVRAEVHAGDRDLLVAGGDRAVDVVEDGLDGTRAAGAARLRDDAVAARLLASGLDAQRQAPSGRRRRASSVGRTGRRRRRTICAAAATRLVLVGVANDVRRRSAARATSSGRRVA